MCGGIEKPCATCAYAGGCLASMRDDEYVPADMDDIISRLDTGKYSQYRKVMKEFLIRQYLYDYDKRDFIYVR